MSELIIYDCDGTLIDSERMVAAICLREIHALGLSTWTLDNYYQAFVGMPGAVGWARVAAELGKDLPGGLNDRVDSAIHAALAADVTALEGVRAAIEAIPGPRCVASTTAQPVLSRNLATAGLLDLFGTDVFSASQVRRAKPAPDVFLFAASQMGLDPCDCLVIEDSVPGVLAARRAGMTAVGFTGAALDPDVSADRLLEAGALAIAAHMDELPALVRSIRARLTARRPA